MWRTNTLKLVGVGLLGLGTGLLAFFVAYQVALYVNPAFRQSVAIAPCHAEKSDLQQIECVFRILGKELRAHGVGAAMETFSAAYRDFPSFVASACHVQAHRVGDMAYYEIYTGAKDLDSMDLPQSTTACGYGFYHGFLEHLIQNNPDPAFVTKTCGYFTNRLGKTMGDIERICYHGSGHGFLLAKSARASKSEWGDVNTFIRQPIALCDQLAEANENDVEECKEGIFNVLAEWMWLKQYGFKLERDTLFSTCTGVPETAQKACYYEMAQKSPGFTNDDPVELHAYVAQIADPAHRLMSFQVGIAGIVQSVIVQESGHKDLLASCGSLDDTYYSSCMHSTIAGLYEHGEPQQEYKKPLDLCEEPSVALHNKKDTCYKTVATRMPRFYSSSQIVDMCKEFPKQYQYHCQDLKLGK